MTVVVHVRRPLTALVGALVAVGLVFGTVDYALGVPSRGFLGALPGAQLLDYTRLVGRFVPLTDAFVRKQLHIGGATSGSSATGPGGPSAGSQFVAPTGTLGRGPAGTTAGITVSHPFTNDNFTHAYVVLGVPFTARTRPKGATRQQGEPGTCARSGGTAWYRYDAPSAQTLEADTFGTSYADTLGVFQGTSINRLQTVGCSSSPVGNAELPFRTVAGKTYYFQISGRVGQGKLRFHLGPLGRTDLGSVTSGGVQANGDSEQPYLSANGRYLVFESGASNLSGHRDPCSDVPATTTSCAQIYLRDLLTGTTRLVSYATNGLPAQGLSISPTVTGDGRYVAFLSSAIGLVPGLPAQGNCAGEAAQYPPTASRTTLCLHLYRRDMSTGAITVISKSNAGQMSNGMDFNYSMTENGQYISFLSDARNLVRGVRIPRCNPAFYLVEDTGGGTHCTQTYLWHANTVRLVSVRTTGDPGTGHSTATDVSDDGRYVAFSAEDYGYQKQYKVPAGQDMYIRDMKTGKTTLECLSSSGAAGDRACVAFAPYTGQFMSSDARYIVFESSSTNLSSQSPKSTKVIAFYVRDRQAGTTVRVDVANDGAPGAGGPLPSVGSIVISADGRWIAFVSSATNLDAQSKQGHQEVYLRDGATGSLSLASTSTTGTAGDGDSFSPTLTRDGSLVAFESTSGNLVTHDANAHQCPADVGTNCSNVYLHTNVGAAS